MSNPFFKKRLWWIITIAIIITTAVVIYFWRGTTYDRAIQLSKKEYAILVQHYLESKKDTTLGGMISREELANLVRPDGFSEHVYFLFGIDPDCGKTTLMLHFNNLNDDGTTDSKFLRNGGCEESFCPAVCAVLDAPSVSMEMTAEEYNEQHDRYRVRFSGLTEGGSMDRRAFRDLLESLPPSQTTVGFRFCLDPESGERSVIFIGGAEGSISGAMLYLRNNSFCPATCE